MKKLIIPVITIMSVFASCEKDEIPTMNHDVKTTTVTSNFKIDENGSNTGKMQTKIVGGGNLKTYGIIAPNAIKDVQFEFASIDVLGYKTNKNYPLGLASYDIEDVALGNNKITITAKTVNNPENKYAQPFQVSEVYNLATFKDSINKQYYAEYETIIPSMVISPSPSIEFDLQPITSKLNTGFRISDSEINKGGYKMQIIATVENASGTPIYTNTYTDNYTANNDGNIVSTFITSDRVAYFESSDTFAKSGNKVHFHVVLYSGSDVAKVYDVYENYENGKSINTFFTVSEFKLIKDTAAVVLNILDLQDFDNETEISN